MTEQAALLDTMGPKFLCSVPIAWVSNQWAITEALLHRRWRPENKPLLCNPLLPSTLPWHQGLQYKIKFLLRNWPYRNASSCQPYWYKSDHNIRKLLRVNAHWNRSILYCDAFVFHCWIVLYAWLLLGGFGTLPMGDHQGFVKTRRTHGTTCHSTLSGQPLKCIHGQHCGSTYLVEMRSKAWTKAMWENSWRNWFSVVGFWSQGNSKAHSHQITRRM